MPSQDRLDVDRRTYLKMTGGAAAVPALSNAVSAQSGGAAAGPERSGAKFDRLDAYLEENGLEAVWFADSDSYAWLTGRSNVIDRSSPTGVAAVGYDGTDLTIVVDDDERALVRPERFEGDGSGDCPLTPGLPDVAIETYPWYRGSLSGAVADVSPTPAAADFDVPGFETVNASPLRQPLTPAEIPRYRTLGEETAAAVEGVCRNVAPGDTEEEVAAALGCALDEYGIDHPVVLVAGEERAPKYRHPVPRDVPVEGYLVVSVVGHRLGQYASCTRTVAFDPPEWLRDRHRVAMRVDATALAATQNAAGTDRTASDVFEVIRSGYAAAGWPDEWKEHHQGGAAGYASREWVATPTADADVTAPMAYAWNPTVRGAKSEGTVLVTEAEFDAFTLTGDWPTQTVGSYEHETEITRPDVLYKDG